MMTAQVIPAPSRTETIKYPSSTIFLAGSTSGGIDWRKDVISALASSPVTILDPARPDWDSTWREDPEFEPWREQVEWELEMQERATVVVVWFAEGTKAPISLLELGMCAKEKVRVAEKDGGGREGGGEQMRSKAVVVCPGEYWKAGNVRMVCRRYGVEMADGVDGVVRAVRERFGLM